MRAWIASLLPDGGSVQPDDSIVVERTSVINGEKSNVRVPASGIGNALGGTSPVMIPIASRAAPSYGTGTVLSDGTTQGGTARVQHKMLVSARGIIFAYSNFYNNAGTETDGPNDITVAAAVDDNNATLRFPLTFNGGQRQVVIKPGTTVFSDPLGQYFPKGTTFYSRTFVSVGAGLKFPRGSDVVNGGASSNEGHNYPATATVGADLTPLGSANTGIVNTNNGQRVYGPTGIFGVARTRVPTPPAIVIIGDSIAAGSGDTGAFLDWGYIERALNLNYPFQQLAYPSETVDGWMQQGGATRFRRASIMERITGATAILCELGINSIGNVNWQPNLDAVWAYLATFGVPVYQTTITPNTTSTDGWVTTVNQTPTVNEVRRVAMNARIRSVPSPLTGIFEVADLVETSRDSGIWRATYTADGIHPSAVGAAAAAPGINPAVFGNAAT